MSVEIDPQELGFRRPFTVEVAQILKIKNPNGSPVAFKVKTTAPKQYCVRPNSGRIEPGHEVEVSVLLQAMKQEPAPDARCRDKFLVQSVTITPDKEFSNVQQIWDGVPKSDIQERKIRVSWLSPNEDEHVDTAATPVRRSLLNGHEDTPNNNGHPPAYSSPNDESTVLDNSPPPAQPETRAEPQIKKEEDNKPPVFNAPTTVAGTVKSAVNDTVEEMKAKLAKAEETIAQLRDEAASGLRQRLVAKKDDNAPASQQAPTAQATRQGTEGVPVKIVAVLCLVSFLLAYFFF